MRTVEGGSFGPETIALMRRVLDEAWESLSPNAQALTSKTFIAERILKLAAGGERDPTRLRTYGLTAVMPATAGQLKPANIYPESVSTDDGRARVT